jgi:DnaJ-class molecular chaperone
MIDKVFNKYKNRFITLEEGEEFCEKCKGKGITVVKLKALNMTLFRKPLTCSECLGDGKIDWIEKVTGKPKRAETDGCSVGPGRP